MSKQVCNLNGKPCWKCGQWVEQGCRIAALVSPETYQKILRIRDKETV